MKGSDKVSTGKKILILGNGFDLAHGLPTGYKHFLEFCDRIHAIYTFSTDKNDKTEFFNKFINSWNIDNSIKEEIIEAFDKRTINKIPYEDGTHTIEVNSHNSIIQEIENCLKTNIWYWYFKDLLRDYSLKGVNWIDFESTISEVISFVDRYTENLMIPHSEICETLIRCSKDKDKRQFGLFGNLCKCVYKDTDKWKLIELRERWYYDLECLIRALELYLSHFVENIQINKKLDYITKINPDYVINFNYTNTYERIYHKKEEVFYIHGQCNKDRSIEDNNMVLGIDEYWNIDECSEHTNYAIFKKFVQRIRKRTGVKHYHYIKEIEKIFKSSGNIWAGCADIETNYSDGTSIIYVFGHSLDATDKDILMDFFTSDATAIKIFCKDKGTEGELVAKTIKLMQEKNLINKANQLPPRIEFINQEKL